jgi:uncharacterized protein YdeI (BOF family)
MLSVSNRRNGTFRDPTGTIKVRIQQKVWNGQHFDAQDLVRVSGR